ncbi:MAG: PulJ/GspJ family protein [Phycisphaerae bacterium]
MRSGESKIVNGALRRSAAPRRLAFSRRLSAKDTKRRSPVLRAESRLPQGSQAKTRSLNRFLSPAFTLTELLVSLVILVGMMTLIATIFATAGKSSGAAQTQVRLHRQLLQAADAISVDLANTLPGTDAAGIPKGVLAVAGVTIVARETARSAEFPHRADVLMLLTQQQFEPFIYQHPTSGQTQFEQYKQVVYGHADFGELSATGEWLGVPKFVEKALARQWYASDWHLARRVVGFRKPPSVVDDSTITRACQWPLVSAPFLGSDPTGVVTDVWYDANGTITFPGILGSMDPGFYAYDRGGSASGGFGLYQCYIEMKPGASYGGGLFRFDKRQPGEFLFEANASDSLDPYRPYWWWRPNVTSPWMRTDARRAPPSVSYMPVPPKPSPVVPRGYVSREPSEPVHFWPDWFYAPDRIKNPLTDSFRTRLDPTPPPGMPQRTAAHFLPSCSEFKVEFTYDDPSEIPVDPVEGQPILADTNGDGHVGEPYNAGALPDAPAASPINWQSVPPGQIFVWTGLPTDSNVYPPVGGVQDPRNRTFPFRWPRALRITIRAYAPGGALDYPITHTLIHVWK